MHRLPQYAILEQQEVSTIRRFTAEEFSSNTQIYHMKPSTFSSDFLRHGTTFPNSAPIPLQRRAAQSLLPRHAFRQRSMDRFRVSLPKKVENR